MSRILVIDDESAMRRGIREMLRAAHHEVWEGEDADQGLEIVRAQRPDLVICDLHLGAGSGWDVLDAMRGDRVSAAIPLILITGTDTPLAMRQSMDLGADDFLRKPFADQVLLAAVEARLKRQQVLKAQAEQANQQLLGLLEATGDLVAIVDPLTRAVRYMNRAARRLTGLDPDRTGEPVLLAELYPPQAFAEVENQALPSALRDGAWHGETEVATRTGTHIHALQEILVHRAADGAVDHLSIIARDITERERAEEVLTRLNRHNELILNSVAEGILGLDLQGNHTFVNPAAARMLGYTVEELIGRPSHSLWHHTRADGSPYPKEACNIYATFQDGKVHHSSDGVFWRKDGTRFFVEYDSTPIHEAGRLVGAVVTFMDITEHKRAEDNLRHVREQLDLAVQGSNDGIWDWNLRTQDLYLSPRWKDQLGYADDELPNVFSTFEELINPEDKPEVLKFVGRYLKGEVQNYAMEFRMRHKDGGFRWILARGAALRDSDGVPYRMAGSHSDITERRRAEEQLRKLSFAVEQSPASVVITDTAGRIEYVNPKFCAVTGYQPSEVLGQNPRVLKSDETSAEGYQELWQRITSGREWRGEFHNRRKNGERYWEFAVISPIKDAAGNITHFLAVKEDITERKRTEGEREVMELHLRQAQKLESIGQLAAGIAHEINTPMQYIGDNTRFLQDAFGALRRVVGAFQELTKRLRDQPGMAEALAPVEAVLQAADVDYLVAEIPKAIEQSLQGAERVTKIVRAMKEFSHPGTEQKTAVDLNYAIESTITVARNEWKYVAELATDFDPRLPHVPCLPGEFNQVILNLIINAAHAIADVVGKNSGAKGRITISTRRLGDWAEIRLADTGTGIPEAARGRIFVPFFTTKPVGKGTGQGLAIAHSVIVNKHGGTLTFETETGRGTTFIIRLPLTASEPAHP
jgi:PAS domain S-box-containing protein